MQHVATGPSASPRGRGGDAFPEASNIEQMQPPASLTIISVELRRRRAMMHKGVEYMVAPTTTPGIWKRQFRIGDRVKTGKTETRIDLLAMRRVQLSDLFDRAGFGFDLTQRGCPRWLYNLYCHCRTAHGGKLRR